MTAQGRTYGEKYHGFRSVPRPPRDIEAEMEAAGAAHDDVALGLAHAKYQTWLEQNGYTQPTLGTNRPDGAIR